jgi:DMSO/TMAO reductase YedYZ molybdopterin-dependent catalytic subunit
MKGDEQMQTELATPQSSHQPTDTRLHIGGLVTTAKALALEDLAQLPRTSLIANFHCDGKSTPTDRIWYGPRLVDVLNLAGPASAASYVRVGAGDYVVPLSREEAEEAVLADTVNGQPLSAENGGPWRLVLPGVRCFASVKWVDRLEVAAEPGENTGLESIRERNRARRKNKLTKAAH